MKITIQKENSDDAFKVIDENKGKTKKVKAVLKEENFKADSGDVNLEVGDGFRFGFGFILAGLVWLATLSLISLVAFELFNRFIIN